ncbi:MAG: hypothetical protein QXS11_07660 [Zestosphaera sp.]
MRKTYMIAAIILIFILFLALLYFYVTSKRHQEPLGWLFTIDVNGEKFKVVVKNSFVAEELRKILRGERFGIVIGELRRGDGGFNKPWSWHLDPDTVEVADATIELCDGMPSFVESELEYWLNVVKRYCPWNTKVIAEEPWYGVWVSCWLMWFDINPWLH